MLRRNFWQTYRHKIIQIAILGGMAAILWFLAHRVTQRLQAQDIATGFGFLFDRAGYDLGESLISYNGDDSYGRALLAGFSNTLKVAVSSIFAAVLIGFLAAAAMLSGHNVAIKIAQAYVRIVRNTPLLLQLFFWFGIFSVGMPPPSETMQPLAHVFISNRGINFPWPDLTLWGVIFVGVLIFAGTFILAQRQRTSGISVRPVWFGGLCLILALGACAWFFGIGTAQIPVRGRFSISGGAVISPEFLTVFTGLSIYTGTYIAEAVRGAVQAVSVGQTEAAQSLGMGNILSLRLVVLPQATRIAMPSIVNELLNLVKNSSLGVAVGYPELVSAGNTAMNQTGQAIELIAIYMLFYVSINIVITKLSQVLEARYAW